MAPLPGGVSSLGEVGAFALAGRVLGAIRRPRQWPAALGAVRQALGCDDVYAEATAARSWDLDEVRGLARRAGDCAALGRGGCAMRGDHPCRATCAALSAYLSVAVAPAGSRPAGTADWLEAMAEPALVCDDGLTILHANRLARGGRWVSALPRGADGRLQPGAGAAALRLAMARVQAARARRAVVALPSGERIVVTRLHHGDTDGDAFLLRLPVDGLPWLMTLTPRRLALGLAPLRLTRRQQALAVQLLQGRSLSAAAVEMGIARATANEHLSALFRRAGVRRQADLLNWLAAHFER